MFSISFRNFRDEKNNFFFTLIIKMCILFARGIITPIARASSVFLSSYIETRFLTNQRAYFLILYSIYMKVSFVFSLCYFFLIKIETINTINTFQYLHTDSLHRKLQIFVGYLSRTK